eukprot:COSAG06_NODE_1437_length_9464_cov_98.879445_10_plen_189_part_00
MVHRGPSPVIIGVVARLPARMELGKPDSNGLCPLYYCGSSRQRLKQRMYGHRRAARCDPLKSPLHQFAYAENQVDPMSDWTCTQLCEFEYDTVLCVDAWVLMEQYFIDRLWEVGYNGMRMKNNAICQDTKRRSQMARWRAAHPGYMVVAAREHKQRHAQKLHAQRDDHARVRVWLRTRYVRPFRPWSA